MNLRRHCALFDVHVPHQIKLSPVMSFIKDFRPTDFIIGGDFLNLEFCSHHNEREFKHIGYEKLARMVKQEVEAGKQLLQDLNKILPSNCNKYYIPGNHESWLYDACLLYPMIVSGLNLGTDRITFKSDLAEIRKIVLADLLTSVLDADKMGFKVLPLDKELTLGKLTYIHGHQVNSLAAMKRRYPARNVVAGHLHTHQVDTLHNSGDMRRANQYVLAPCLCNLSPGYLKDGSTRWLSGFYIADVLPSGLFSGSVVKVIDGHIMYGNKIYK